MSHRVKIFFTLLTHVMLMQGGLVNVYTARTATTKINFSDLFYYFIKYT